MVEVLPDFLKDPDAILKDEAEWHTGSAPDYSLVNALFEKERSIIHEPGSLEDQMNNLIKNWEREASHKKNPMEWRTMDVSKFKFAANGIWVPGEKLAEEGNYNVLIGETEFYSAKRVATNEASHKIFRGAFKDGFGWEVLEVVSPPPRVVVKWRHWGKVTGGMKCPMRNGQDLVVEPSEEGKPIEIFGVSILTLDDQYRITALENFWNPDQLMQQIAN